MFFVKTKYYPLKGYNAITHWPFVFYKKDSAKTRRHEYIHAMQQKELFVILFYLIYFVEWIFKGYRNISFEKEAFENEQDIHYHLYRKPYTWLRYLKKK